MSAVTEPLNPPVVAVTRPVAAANAGTPVMLVDKPSTENEPDPLPTFKECSSYNSLALIFSLKSSVSSYS